MVVGPSYLFSRLLANMTKTGPGASRDASSQTQRFWAGAIRNFVTSFRGSANRRLIGNAIPVRASTLYISLPQFDFPPNAGSVRRYRRHAVTTPSFVVASIHDGTFEPNCWPFRVGLHYRANFAPPPVTSGIPIAACVGFFPTLEKGALQSGSIRISATVRYEFSDDRSRRGDLSRG
jgi:hypothetical protein